MADIKNCSRKTCSQNNPQDINQFGKCKNTINGLRPECKSCRKIEAANAYKRNPEQFQARNKRWADKYPDKLRQSRINAELNSKPYRKHKKNECQSCGFKALDMCQLDVDHIDGNHSNNDPLNLQTLCANCHRIKTKLNKNGQYSPNRFKVVK